MNLKFIATLIVTLILIACNGIKKTSAETSTIPNAIVEQNMTNKASAIENTKWIISTLEAKDMSSREKNGQIIYFSLNPEENRINRNSGCNTFFGNYNLSDNQSLSFSALASTRMMCQDVEINETQITNILKKTNSFIMIDDILILKNGQQNTLATFKKMEIEEPITEKYWKLKQLGRRYSYGRKPRT